MRLAHLIASAAALLPAAVMAGTAADAAPAVAPAIAATAAPVAGPSVLPMIVALVFVVALIPAAVWLMKRMGAGQGAGRGTLRVVDSLNLGQRERLVVVDDGQEFILLGVTAHSIKRVGTQPRRELPAAPAVPAGFAELLRRARSRHEA